jgi:hypothetical protein
MAVADNDLIDAIVPSGNLRGLRDALGRGANPNIRISPKNAPVLCYLLDRTWHDRKECIAALLAARADPNLADDEGRAPLHLAAASTVGGSLDVLKLLLEYGADINQRGKDGATPLHEAVTSWLRSNAPALMMHLLESGADTTAVNDAGQTPLQVALDHYRGSPKRQQSVSELFASPMNSTGARQAALRKRRKTGPDLTLGK